MNMELAIGFIAGYIVGPALLWAGLNALTNWRHRVPRSISTKRPQPTTATIEAPLDMAAAERRGYERARRPFTSTDKE